MREDLLLLFRELHQTPILFYPVHRQLCKKLTTSLLLAYLFRQWAHYRQNVIFSTDDEIKAATSLTDNELRGAKDELKSLPFISITREGIKGRTHYKLRELRLSRRLAEMSDSWISRNRIRGFNESEQENISKRTYKGTAAADGGPPAEVCKGMATKLANALARHRQIDYSKKTPLWALSFHSLCVTDRVPTDRVYKALEWYCTAIPKKDAWLPEVSSGHDFRQKFLRIENAMSRDPSVTKEQAEEPIVDGHRVRGKKIHRPGSFREDSEE